MFSRLQDSSKKILLGTALTGDLEYLLPVAEKLTHKAGRKLRVTHISETWAGRSWIGYLPGEYISTDVAQAIETKQMAEAHKEIQNALKYLPEDVDTEISVISGQPIEALEADAISSNAALILCGTHGDKTNFFPQGFSTPISLMGSSSIPILAIPQNSSFDPDKPNLKIMVCDDLNESNRHLLGASFEFAKTLGHAQIVHLHVCSLTKDEFETLPIFMLEAMSAGILSHGPLTSSAALFEKTKINLENKMAERFTSLRLDNLRYKGEIIFGFVLDEIKSACHRIEPDLIVFGHHEAFHRHPFYLGKMPYRAMVKLNKPVMVIPKA